MYQGEGKKRKQPSTFLRHMVDELYAETGFRKVYAGKVFEQLKKSMEAKETFGHGYGDRKYADSQSADQNRQNAIGRVSSVQVSARNPT